MGDAVSFEDKEAELGSLPKRMLNEPVEAQ
jgi:hypothetical protein